jgi:hypothetical protein
MAERDGLMSARPIRGPKQRIHATGVSELSWSMSPLQPQATSLKHSKLQKTLYWLKLHQ